MYRLIALLIGYAFGCLQTAFFVGKAHGIDIREHGSKNAGMTNVTRTVGKKWGAITFFVDILKGIAAFIVATLVLGGANWLFRGRCVQLDAYDYFLPEACTHMVRQILPGMYAGLGTVLGHCFPFWLKFRGGKGVSSAIGLIIMINPLIAGIVFAFGFAAVGATRYISLASLVVTLFTPISMLFFGYNLEAIIVMTAVTAIIWILHHENIRRLLSGRERKFLDKTKEQ